MGTALKRVNELSPERRKLFELRLARKRQAAARDKKIPRRDPADHYPLSFAQHRLWFLWKLMPESPYYNMPRSIRFSGKLRQDVLEAAFNEIVRRHESLRTTFTTVDEEAAQVVAPALELRLPMIDLSALPDDARESTGRRLGTAFHRRPFSLERGPLMRLLLLRLVPGEHVLFLSVHHIVFDGWSQTVLVRELAAIYEAFAAGHPSPLPELPLQYADFAVWQRGWLTEEMLDAQIEFWQGRMAGAPALLELPADRPRPPVQSLRGDHLEVELPLPLAEALRELAEGQGMLIYMTLMSTFMVLVRRYTDRDDLVIGSPIANRNKKAIEGIIGFFVNMLVARMRISGDPSFLELMGRVNRRTLEGYDNQDLPFERLVEALKPERNLSYTPLFQVMFNLLNFPPTTVELSEVVIKPWQLDTGTSKYDLSLYFFDSGRNGRLAGLFEYSTDLFDRATIERMRDHLLNLFEAVAAAPQTALSDLALLSPGERHELLVERNRAEPEDGAAPSTMHGLFEAQAARTPDAVALVAGSAFYYAELNRRANQLAHYLAWLGVGPDVPVGIVLERNADLLVALLAVLKAGGAYVPMDPSYPPARLAYMVEDAKPEVVLTQSQLVELLPASDDTVVFCMDLDWDEVAGEPADDPAARELPGQLAYVIYTSGSTGRPKGVAVTHRGVVNFLRAMSRRPGLASGDVFLSVTTLSFDIAVLEIFVPLAVGARVVLATSDEAADGARLLARLRASRATAVQATPATWGLLLEAGLGETAAADAEPERPGGRRRPPSRRAAPRKLRALSGGEALPRALADRLLASGAELWNMYGPTETTIWSSVQRVEPGDGPIPLGRPIAATWFYVLDRWGDPAPLGVAGELLIGGAGLARGYLERPALTAERFVPDPFAAADGGRLYRTGDLVRFRPGDVLEFLGRIDHQVKVRGFRIELGEIETALAAHPALGRAVVVARRSDSAGGDRLVAYLTPVEGAEAPSVEALRGFVGERLPDYMVPSSFVVLESFPLTPSGKVDRRALPDPDAAARPSLEAEYREPRTPLERHIADGWRRILQVEEIGVHDRFFDLGGNSIQAAIFTNQVQKELREILHVTALFQAQTISEFIAFLEQEYPAAMERLAKKHGWTAEDAAVEAAPRPPAAPAPPDRGIDELAILEMRRLAAETSARRRRRRTPRQAKNPRAIFVLSPPRAGSTLVRVMLAGHPKLFSPPELELLHFETLGQRAEEFSGAHGFAKEGLLRAVMEIRGTDAEGAREEMARYEEEDLPVARFYGLVQEWCGGRTLVDKTSTYALDPAALARAEELFDEPLYIHLARHPCATIKSYVDARLDQFLRFDNPFTARQQAELLWVIDHQNIFEFLAGVPAERRFLLRFEDLVTQPVAVTRDLCAWLGLELVPEMLLPYEGEKMTDGIHAQSRMHGDPRFHEHRTIDPAVAEKWRAEYPEDVLADITRQLMAELGYGTPGDDEPGGDAGPGEGGGPKEPSARIVPGAAGGEGSAVALSFAQERLWLLNQLEPDDPAYNIAMAVRLRGPFVAPAFARALGEIVRRHAALRTAFRMADRRPAQVIEPAAGLELPLADLGRLAPERREDELRRLRGWESARVFDLARPPLLRSTLLRLAPDDHALLLSLHHIVGDGWSLGLLMREAAVLYEAFRLRVPSPLAELPVQYADFAVWQRRWLAGARLEAELGHWRAKLAGAPVLELPTDRPRPAIQTFRGEDRWTPMRGAAGEALRGLGRTRGATLFMTLLTAFGALLRRYSGQDDLTVGVPVAGRRHQETELLIGFFVNALALRLDAAGDPSFAELLGRVRGTTVDAFAHQDLPFEKLVDELKPERDRSRTPLFQVLVQLHNEPDRTVEVSGLTLSAVEGRTETAKFDLVLNLVERPPDVLLAMWRFNKDLFDTTTVLRLARHFRTALERAAADPDAPLSRISALTVSERQQLVTEPAATEAGRREATLVELFEAQVRERPQAVAVEFESARLTYGELDRRAGVLAGRLRSRGVAAETRVALYLDRSLDTVVGILGVVKAGGAYVPLDPAYPAERLAFILEDCEAPWILTREHLLDGLPTSAARVLTLDRLPDEDGQLPAAAPAPGDAAYVIYTSGSTGRPKGVTVTHGQALRLFTSTEAWYGFGPADVWTLFHSFAFDFSVWELWGALAYGGRLVVVPYWVSRSPAAFHELLADARVTVLNQTPSAFRQLIRADQETAIPLALAWVIFGGEALEPGGLAPWIERHGDRRPRLVNMYGITETTVHVTFRPITRADLRDGQRSVVGRAIPDLELRLVGPDLNPVPIAVAGEILVGGAGVARGYLKRPRLTAERFIPDPYGWPGRPVQGARTACSPNPTGAKRSARRPQDPGPAFPASRPGARLYRSGDLGRWRGGMELDYLGRIDHQVKIRGFRIELGEIEAALARHPAVREAIVEARGRSSEDRALVAWAVPSGDARPALGEVRAFVARRLPEYMLPAALTWLDAWPLTAHGKLDRRALPRPAAAPDERDFAPPATALERDLAELWRETLDLGAGRAVGRDDDFFELGGNSILGAILINRLEQKLGEIVQVVTIFDHPNLASLAGYLVDQHPAAVRRLYGDEAAGPEPGARRERPRVDAGRIADFRSRVRPLAPLELGPANPPAVFVLAPPRSGTTLLRVMLGAHPELFAPPELELLSFNTLADRAAAFAGRDSFWLEGLVRAVMEARGCDAGEAARLIADDEERGLTCQAFYGRLQSWLGGRRLVDKTPSYALDPEILKRAEAGFDGALYVHLVRHPYGMIRSFEEAKLDQIFFRVEHPYARRELAELIWLASHQNIIAFLETVPAERRCTVAFEDLVGRSRPVMEELCGFLGLGFEPRMLRPYEKRSEAMTDGLHAASRMLGDVKFHQHRSIDARVAERWRDDLAEDFLGEPTRDLAEALGYPRLVDKAAPKAALAPLVPRPPGAGPLPLSFSQQRLWFLDQWSPGGAAYNISHALRLEGELDPAVVAAGLDAIVRRHESLRTTFEARDGQPFQVVEPYSPRALPVIDLSSLADGVREAEALKWTRRECGRSFDLGRGPLLRAALLRLGPRRHWLPVAMHHIVSDGWSMGMLVRELVELYGAAADGRPARLPELAVQYPDFALWQRDHLSGERLEAHLAYWRDRLAGAPALLEMPTDRPRPKVESHRGRRRGFALTEDLSRRLEELARRREATLFMLMLAALDALFSRMSGQRDVVVGSPNANRNRKEIEDLIGFFVNTLVLRVDLSGRPRFSDVLSRVRESVRGAMAHQDLPFEKLVEELQPDRNPGHSPIFQVMLALQNAPRQALELPGLTVSQVEGGTRTAKFDLLFTVSEGGGRIGGGVEYATDLFDAVTVQRLIAHFRTLLAGIAADPETPIAELELLSPAGRGQLLGEWNDTGVRYEPACLHRAFEAQVDRSPDAAGLVFAAACLSYRGLDRRANRLAHRLIDLGIRPDDRVGVLMERSLEMVVALYAVLKAGGAYVPLDPAQPDERQAFMLADFRRGVADPVVLTQTALAERVAAVAGGGLRVVAVDAGGAPMESHGLLVGRPTSSAKSPQTPFLKGGLRDERPAVTVGLDHAAYAIYTSGSTGRPKGTVNSHRGIANRLLWMQDAFGLTRRDRVVQKTPFTFDVSVWELFWPLLVGAKLVVARPGGHQDAAYLARLIRREGVTTAHFVPSMLQVFVDEPEAADAGALARVIASGEALPPELCERFAGRLGAAGTRLHNLYGPTEAAVDVTWFEVRGAPPRVPIGRPIANTAIHVLDRGLEPAPVGAAGELHLGGVQLARGYLGRPALTAEKFVPDHFAGTGGSGGQPGGRLYKTGDLTRRLPGGEVEYLGRIDFQVKVRGFRVELGEIQAALESHPAVATAAALALADRSGALAIAAYVAPRAGAAPAAGELRAHLAERLPDYMVPAAFVVLDELPLTAHGKLDRAALPAPAWDGAGAEWVAPRTPLEEHIATIWSDVLGGRRVGAEDHFFELGGHSLLATRVVSRLRRDLDVEVPVRLLFEAPTLGALALEVDRLQRRGLGADVPPLERRPGGEADEVVLSWAQERLWFLDLLDPGSPVYNITMPVRLTGPLAVDRFWESMRRVVERHEALRTTFPATGGRPSQQLRAELEPTLALADLGRLPGAARRAELERRLAAEARWSFDLARGPLVRVLLLRLGAGEHALSLNVHHIVTDGWSMGVLVREVAAFYDALTAGRSASPLPELPVQYSDFSLWQRRWLASRAGESTVLERQVAYWRERLAGLAPLALPSDRPRPPVATPHGATLPFALSREVRDAVRELGLRTSTTLFMALCGAFQGFLGRVSGERDLAVGTPIAGRNHPSLEGLIGFFVNTLALRADLRGDPTFEEVLARTRESTLAAYAHQDLPFQKLVEELDPERNLSTTPFFQVMFAVENTAVGSSRLPDGLTIEPVATAVDTAKFDLGLGLADSESGLQGRWAYRRSLFDATTVRRLAEAFRRLLAGALADPARRLSELPLLGVAERHQLLLELNAPADYPAPELLHPMIEAWAQRQPRAAALAWDGRRIGYGELDRRAGRLARRLAGLGVGPEVVVGVCLERSFDLVASVLAVFKAGGVFLPLDPAHPAERLTFIARDAGTALLVTTSELADRLAAIEVPVLELDRGDERPAETDVRPAAPDNAAYVIYTSGSTGRPKGVMVSYRALANRIAWVAAFETDRATRYLQKTTISFDVSLAEIFGPLAAGGRCVLPRAGGEKDVDELVELISGEGLTHVSFPPTILNLLLDDPRFVGYAGLVQVITGGETVPPELPRRFHALGLGARLQNRYGPTETTISVTLANLAPEARDAVPPIGRPISNAEIFLADRGLEAAPLGVPAEIAVGGTPVARGYLGRPARTAESFVPHPFARPPRIGERLYKTGDLARLRRDGAVEFIGRVDHQVKIRGFRVELGEIEAELARCPGVREAAVVDLPDGATRKLAAYVVPANGAAPDAELRGFLRRRLPEHMVPSAFVTVERLPLSATGKVDRRALPAPRWGAAESLAETPASLTEELVAGIWETVLDARSVGRHDDFFDLGGHSLLATQVVSRVRDAFGIELELRRLFEAPTVAGLAAAVERARAAGHDLEAPPIVRVDRSRPLPLSFAQERLWFLDQLEPGSSTYNISTAVELEGELDVAALAASYADLVRRHEPVRTRFLQGGGGVFQSIEPPLPEPLPVVDLAALPEAARGTELERRMAAEARRPFDLAGGRLLRIRLVRLSGRRHAALIATHHAVSDAWSMGVTIRELTSFYAAAKTGREAPAEPPDRLQYADFAVWQRRWLAGDVLARHLAFWRGKLAGVPSLLELPADRPRPVVRSEAGAVVMRPLSAAVRTRVTENAHRRGSTVFMSLLAAFEALVHRSTHRRDVVVGLPVAGRNRSEVEDMIGFFINTLVLHTDAGGDPSFDELLTRVRAAALDAYDHQDLPFEKLVEELQPERSLAHAPLVQVIFQQYQAPASKIELPGLTVRRLGVESRTSKLDLVVSVRDGAGGLIVTWRYATDLFDETTVERMARHYAALVEAAADDPGRPLSRLPLVAAAEAHQIEREWNDPETGPVAGTLHALFAAHARRDPSARALLYDGRWTDYGELDRRSDELARVLAGRGVGRGSQVGLFLERTPELVAAVLGVLKAGAAYVPLDPIYPAERLAFVLEDTAVPVVLTQESLRSALPRGAFEAVAIDGGDEEVGRRSEIPPDAGTGAEDLAYVIYTSGSTGRPKGVAVTHGHVLRLLTATDHLYGFSSSDVWTLFHSYAFDFSVWEIWGALGYGGSLVVVPQEVSRSPELFLDLVAGAGVTVLNQTPSAFRQLIRADAAAPRPLALAWVIFGGEALEPRSLAPWFARRGDGVGPGDDGPRLVNMYGITETTVHVTYRAVARADLAGGSVVGRAIPDLALHLLGPRFASVPLGAAGEIYVGGAGVSRGYLGRPALTAARFVPDHFSVGAGARLYRSGDLGRFLAGGDLEYLGRIDHQVQIRGFRVELGEIERSLAAHPAVREAVAVTRGDRSEDLAIAAYVVPASGAAPELGDLRTFLSASLPDYMLPSALVVLERLPLTASGKVDRRALPEPARVAGEDFAAPETPVERYLAELWREMLGLGPDDPVGRGDNFFEFGGNSIRGAVLTNRLQRELGEIVHVVTVFDAPTLAAYADYLAHEHGPAIAALLGEDAAGPAAEDAHRRVDEDRLAEFRGLARRLPPLAPGPANPPAVFVLAPPRSGTTLLRVMLAGHPRLFAPPELELLSWNTLGERRAAYAGADSFWLEGLVRAVMEIHGCDGDQAARIVGEYEDRDATTQELYGRLQEWLGERLLVDKTPSYALDPEILARAEACFDRPLYVHLTRHPYGMIRSFEEAKLDQIFFRREHPFIRRELAELVWVVSQRNILDFLAGVPAERRIRVAFEDLVREPSRVMGELCAFLGIDADPAVLSPYEDDSRRMTDGPRDVSRMLGDVKFHQHRTIDPGVAERWREHYRRDFLGEPAWELAERLGYDRPRRAELPPLEARPRDAEDAGVLSYAQERLWFIDQLEPGQYNLPLRVRLAGELDAAVLRRALEAVAERHEALRTTFENRGGEPRQVIHAELAPDFRRVDLTALPLARRRREAERVMKAEGRQLFDLGRGPLARAALIRLEPREHYLVVNLHHIVSDGWSLGILQQELAASYLAFAEGRAPSLPALAVQYADFARWQRRWLDAGELERQLAYWRRRLDGLPALELPTDRPRPRLGSGRGAIHRVDLPAGVAAGLEELGREAGTTLFMTAFAAFSALVARFSEQRDLALGTVSANRGRPEIEGLIGFFVNTLVLRSETGAAAGGAAPTFRELLDRTREATLAAYAHQDVPFQKLVEELDPPRGADRTPFFQVLFTLDAGGRPMRRIELSKLAVEPLEMTPEVSKFDLTLLMRRRGTGGFGGWWAYKTDLFDATTVARFAACFRILLEAAAADPGARLSALPLLSPGEGHQLLVEWNAQPAGPAAEPIGGLLAARAELEPDAVALIFDPPAGPRRRLTYAELDARAEVLASRLRRAEVGPEVRVGVCLERSPELLASLLAVLRCGAVYLPLDPGLPEDRLAFLIADAAPAAMLTTAPLAARLPDGGAPVIDVGRQSAAAGGVRPPGGARPGNAAYVIYTSGSTGVPKGVVVSYGSLANRVRWAGRTDLDRDSRFLAKTTISFDVSLVELLTPLTAGGTVVMARPGDQKDTGYLARLIATEAVSNTSFPPTILGVLLGDRRFTSASALSQVITGGETVPAELPEGFYAVMARADLVNRYGPTEATVSVSQWICPRGVAESALPIGRPIGGAGIHLVDRRLEPLPAGLAGEIVIAGPGLARGYLARPARTAESFVPHPLAARPGERLYRSGDLARYRADGALLFLGRIDSQVKIRGFRVELGEIEAVLASHPAVAEAAVVDIADGATRRLVAYVAPEKGAEPERRDLRRLAARRLPDYMVPSAIVALDALPLSPTGKIDRAELGRRGWPGPETRAGGPRVAPRSPAEKAVARIWTEVLRLAEVGVDDDFFELGGHSLMATHVAARLHQEVGVEVPLRELFDRPTVAALAAWIDDAEPGEPAAAGPRGSLLPLRVEGEAPPLFCVHPVGGHAFCYRELARLLGGEHPFYGVQSPGPGGAPLTTVEAMAERYLEEIRAVQAEGPYFLAGFSSGGLVAYEMARRLEAGGEAVGFLGLIDSAAFLHELDYEEEPQADDEAERVLELIERLFFVSTQELRAALDGVEPGRRLATLLATLKERGQVPADFTEETLAHYGNVREVNRLASVAYVPGPYRGQALLLRSEEMRRKRADYPGLGWADLVADLVVVEVDGEHNDLLRPPHVGRVARELRRFMEERVPA